MLDAHGRCNSLSWCNARRLFVDATWQPDSLNSLGLLRMLVAWHAVTAAMLQLSACRQDASAVPLLWFLMMERVLHWVLC